jgi:hypothetical protein
MSDLPAFLAGGRRLPGQESWNLVPETNPISNLPMQGPFTGRFIGLVLWDVTCAGHQLFCGEVEELPARGPADGTLCGRTSSGTISAGL